MSEVEAPAIDKADCASEPIHIPGAIQPHGYLFVLDANNHAVVAVSRNAADAFDLSPADMLGRPASDFLASRTPDALDDILARQDSAPAFRVAMRTPSRCDDLDGVIRAGDGVILLELEVGASAQWESRLFGEVRSAIERIRHSPSTEAACQALTERSAGSAASSGSWSIASTTTGTAWWWLKIALRAPNPTSGMRFRPPTFPHRPGRCTCATRFASFRTRATSPPRSSRRSTRPPASRSTSAT